MDRKLIISKLPVEAFFVLLGVIYLLLPNINHLGDSYGYGASVKYGVDLFQPHHLLYTWINYLSYNCICRFVSIDALRFMQALNAVGAICCLFVLRKIILIQTGDLNKANWLSIFVGCSFGVMRFAVEAEVYIFPIFFSLLSSILFVKYVVEKQSSYLPFLSGIMATLACLFHQIHLFWGIGLFLGWLLTKQTKSILLYLLPTPLVLVAYVSVLKFYYHQVVTVNSLFHYMASYYYSSSADVGIGLKDLLITAITFFRTFFQVHGLVIEMYRLLPFLSAVSSIVVVITLIWAIREYVQLSGKFSASLRRNNIIEHAHALIFIFQFAFAFYSHGNSEFMVMLPFAMAITAARYQFSTLRAFRMQVYVMFLWNLMFGILPNSIYDFQNNRIALGLIHNNPNELLIVKERIIPVNQYFYLYGEPESKQIIELNDLNKDVIDKSDFRVYLTEMISKKELYSRVDFTKNSQVSTLKLVRHVKKVKSVLGDFYIDEVRF